MVFISGVAAQANDVPGRGTRFHEVDRLGLGIVYHVQKADIPSLLGEPMRTST